LKELSALRGQKEARYSTTVPWKRAEQNETTKSQHIGSRLLLGKKL
jgi:hypothetical protein